jgi:excisionase family DNA binding protein
MKLTVKEAAERAGVSESLVYTWCRTRLLAHYRFGCNGRGKIMIEASDLDAFLEGCRVDGEGELRHIG